MPAWIVIDEALVLARLSSPELDAFRNAAIQAGQADPLTEVINLVIPDVRRGIGANRENVLAEGNTLPESALRHALAIIRVSLATRLPGMDSLIDPIRTKEWENAEKWVLSKPLVEKPDDVAPPEEQIATGQGRWGSKPKIGGRV